MRSFADKVIGSVLVNYVLKLALKVPVSKRKLQKILKEAGNKQLAEIMLGLNYYDFIRVQRALYEHPKSTQKVVLQEMLSTSENTEIGKKYDFKNIKSVSDFRKKVPISAWEDYEEYANRLTKGESDILFPGKASFFYRTSGTTANYKYIPESEREGRARTAMTKARNAERMVVSSLGAMHRVFAFFNRSNIDLTEGGIPRGTASGRTPQLQGAKPLKRLAYSPQIVEEFEGEELHYMMMRCTLVYDDVTSILGNNAKMMTGLIYFAKEHAEEIIEDIRKGTSKYPMSDKLKELEKEALKPNPRRADELQELLRQDRFTPKYYWPHLLDVGFWLGGSVGVHVDEIRKLLPEKAKYVDVGYGSSEAKINIPMAEDTPAGPLSICSSFYEFIPEEGGEPLLADELQDGKNYEIILTTYGGLYRYCLRDMIHVEGFTGKTPNIYFLTKTSDVANLGQEKIPGVLLMEAIQKTVEQSGFSFKTTQVYTDPDTMSYVICIETDKKPEDIEAFKETMEESLQTELDQYRSYRSKMLNMCDVAFMKEGWLESLMKKYAKGNATTAQVKIPVVINSMPDAEWIQESTR